MKTGFWLRGGNGKLAGATVYQDGQGNTVDQGFSDLFGIVGGGLPFGELHLTQVPDHVLPYTVDSDILHLLFLHFIVGPHLVRAFDVLGIGDCA